MKKTALIKLLACTTMLAVYVSTTAIASTQVCNGKTQYCCSSKKTKNKWRDSMCNGSCSAVGICDWKNSSSCTKTSGCS